MRAKLFLLPVLCFIGSAALVQANPLTVLPDTAAQGSDIRYIVDDQPPGVGRSVELQLLGGSVPLADVVIDALGQAAGVASIPPALPPRQYTVNLVAPGIAGAPIVVGSTQLEIVTGPVLQLVPDAGVPGQQVTVQVSGLQPGSLQVKFDGIRILGPVEVDGGYSGSFRVPGGSAGQVQVLAEARVGNLLSGSALDNFSRLVPVRTQPGNLSFDPPGVAAFRIGNTYPVSGQIELPDGLKPTEIQWTLAWKNTSGEIYPVNVTPVAFDTLPTPSGAFRFETLMAVPGLRTGYPVGGYEDITDQFGFTYVVPSTGKTGSIWDALPVSVDPPDVIVITGQILKGDTCDPPPPGESEPVNCEPLADALFTVTSKTALIDPDDVEGSKATQAGTGAGAAFLHDHNQVTESRAILEAEMAGFTTAGCPITLYNGQTDADGRYQIAFSPSMTDLLNAVLNAPSPDINTAFAQSELEDEFRVRLSGLHLNYGIERPLRGNGVYTGIVYDFHRVPNTGQYEFREGLEGDYEENFSPGDVLKSYLYPFQPGAVGIEIATDPIVWGLGSPASNSNPASFSKLYTFANLASNVDLVETPLEIRLPWFQNTQGVPQDIVLSFDNGIATTMVPAAGPRCTEGGSEFVAQVSGLATTSDLGVLPGRIDAATAVGNWYKDFDIVLAPGPRWFEDPAYQATTIDWSAGKVTIAALETDKAPVTASASDVPYDVGDLDNSNVERNARVTQTLTRAVIGSQERSSQTDTTVAGNSGGLSKRLLVNGPTSFKFTDKSPTSGLLLEAKNAIGDRAALLARVANANDPPNFGNAAALVLIDTGRIPIFRYIWGIPPIASATLGADFWLRVMFHYFGYINVQQAQVALDMLAEPQVQAGLDVFFNFSAALGLVDMTLTASPAFGVAVPFLIYDNVFAGPDELACFQFVLNLVYEVSVGPCPLCWEDTFSENGVIDVSEPSSCSIFNKRQLTKAASPPNADRMGISSNERGVALSIWADTDGIHVARMIDRYYNSETVIPAGPGAMQPDIVFHDANVAVAVWTQSGLTPSQFEDLRNDPTATVFDAFEDQHMVYSVFDAAGWGPVQNLTLPSGGEGGVRLAACMAGDSGCPAGGEVLAVWHRETRGNIKLFYATFDGLVWSLPREVEPLGKAPTDAKGLQPAPIYVAGEPAVVFVRNASSTSSQTLNLPDRRLAYRFLNQTEGVVELDAGPGSVASPSVAAYSDGAVAIAFTSPVQGDPFVGTRRALWIGLLDSCSDGLCDPAFFKQQDQHGRWIYVEQPEILIDPDDRAMVMVRRVGVSGDLRPDDPVGLQGFGDVQMLEFTRPDIVAGRRQFPQSLTVDGAVNWQTEGTYDPSLNTLLIINTKGTAVQQVRKVYSKARARAGLTAKGLSGSRGVYLYGMPHLADLSVQQAVADVSIIAAGDEFTVTVDVANLGTPVQPADSFELQLLWNGPPGLGEAPRTEALFFDAGSTRTVLLDVRAPPFVSVGEVQRLYLVINPDSTTDETDFDNNTQVIAFNELPVPQNLVPSVDLAGTLAFLDWDAVSDLRVTSFRVYRRHVQTLEEFAVGFTPVNGFVDLNVIPGEQYQYRVTALTATLLESDPTDWVTIAVLATQGDLVFANSFE